MMTIVGMEDTAAMIDMVDPIKVIIHSVQDTTVVQATGITTIHSDTTGQDHPTVGCTNF